MTITHVTLLSLPVSDQERARDFYVNTLGFDLLEDEPMGPGQRWVQVAPKGAQMSITLVTWFDSMPPGSLRGLMLDTDDLDGDIATLTERGVRFEGDIQQQHWGRFVTFTDPDGNGLILRSALQAGPESATG